MRPLRAFLLGAGLLMGAGGAWAQPVTPSVPPQDGITALLEQVQNALLEGAPGKFMALVAPGANSEAAEQFARQMFVAGVTQVTLRERDRQPLQGAVAGEGFRLLVESLIERGRAARLVTWRLEVRRGRDDETRWYVVGQEQISSLDGLYRLQLDRERRFAARDLTITSIDFALRLPKGHVFVAETEAGVTAMLLVGKGTMRFAPGPAAERLQVRTFAGSETLEVSFDAAMVRLNPFEYADRVSSGALTPASSDDREARRAEAFFNAQIGQSFSISTDLSPRANWSLTPAIGDFLADVRTARHGILTFARSSGEAEDLTLFDRRRRRNISVYASPQKLETRGRFYDEDDLVDYDIQDYDVEVAFNPEREWLEGQATVALKVLAPSLATLTLKLAESLKVESIVSPQLGRLLHFRVVGQNSIIVSLPSMALRNQLLSLSVRYAGRLAPQVLDREAVSVAADQQEFVSDFPIAQPEPRYIYSNRAYWYPQGDVTDYATATLRITVPEDLGCVGSGDPQGMRVVTVDSDRGPVRRREYTFEARRPLRYLACVISRFNDPQTVNVTLTAPSADTAATSVRSGQPTSAAVEGSLRLAVLANPRQDSRGRAFQERAAAMIRFYSSIAGDIPYPSFTLAVTEHELPGGHSPAYFAVISQPPVMATLNWRNDPVNFEGYPSFFLAHEIAHQWWGQAVGWKNYHEQWISEGFAQYFAALYSRQERGEDTFQNVLRQMRRWAVTYSDQGPISLGYRLGHIKGDSRVFRGVIYNKSAIVLDMLRRLIGDASFYRGLRRFYMDARFRKAGTDDVRKAFESESGEDLGRFFEGWIFSADLPAIGINREIVTGGPDGPALRLVFEQRQPELFDLVIPLAVRYTSGPDDVHEVRVRERRTEIVVPLKGSFKTVDPDPGRITLARFQ